MGNEGHSGRLKPFERESEKLEFYMELVDPQVGRAKIYTAKNRPLRYIMKYESRAEETEIYNTFM
jgi:hypothetical protein